MTKYIKIRRSLLWILGMMTVSAICINAQTSDTESSNKIYKKSILKEQQENMRFLFSGSVPSSENDQKGGANNMKSNICPNQEVNRSVDGTCNNISLNNTAIWGAAGIPLLRTIPDVYNSNNDLVGQNRKNPREISNIIFEADCGPSSKRLSSFVFTWGQFLDHDITRTPENPAESFPIPPVPNDIITAPITFHRSSAFPGTGNGTGLPRQQQNNITSWIDGSNVYGSDVATANSLRSFIDGKLIVTNSANGDLLPLDANGFFIAGDGRVNEQPGLSSLHTLFMREHNRICDQLVLSGMTNDEDIYQKARKEVGAILQSITYNEFLPALGIAMPNYGGYDNTIHADINNVFATAAFRLGHTMVTDNVPLYDDNGNNTGNLSLAQAFFNPSHITNNGIEEILNGLAQQFQEEIDAKIVENLRSFLFTPSPTGPGLDLAALNIQRGRDHGLDDYNAFRQFFTGTSASSFANISSDPVVQAQLATAYDNDVNNIDVWVGLLAEDHLPNSAVGATLNAILADQFTKLRDGDFYFFENDPAFTNAERTIINNTTLSDVIKRNTNIVNIKNQVFYAPCPVSKNLSTIDNITGNAAQTHKVSSTITANNLVDNTSNAVYDGGFDVTLTAGFDAQMGANFHALINGCNSGSFNKTGTEKSNLTSADLQIDRLKIHNSPNPFSDITSIEFDLDKSTQVNLSVLDASGKVVTQLLNNNELEAGNHKIDFDGANLLNGIYILKLQTGNKSISHKMVLSR